MRKFMIGIVFILLIGTIMLDTHVIELTPNFIGSLLLLSVIKEFQVKDIAMKRSLYALTVVFFVNYALQVIIPNGLPLLWGWILVGGTLLWSTYIAIKLIQNIKRDRGLEFKVKPLRIGFLTLFATTIAIEVESILFVLLPRTSFRAILLFGLTGFVWTITRYLLIYLFYKEFKNIKLIK